MEDYNPNEVNSILLYARKLEGKSLLEVTSLKPQENHNDYEKVKGKFGQVLEKNYFGLTNNSDSEPDFKKAKVELKSTPMKKLSNGDLVAKERLVLNIINYEDVVKETWETSSFLTKNQLILLIFYLYEQDKSFLEFLIKYVKLWNIRENDIELIKQDWSTIVKKIADGKAHELSEGDTFYLSACRKGSGKGKDLRKQPNSTIKAPQRAFSFKSSYMNSIIKKIEDSESLFKEKELTEPFEKLVYSKFEKFLGKEITEIENLLSIHLNRDEKSYFSNLARRMMGIEKRSVEEFEKADINMKIIRLKENGLPKEDMSFPKMIFKEVVNQKWEESDFYNDLTKKFFFIVYQIDGERTYFKKAFFWNIPFEDLKEVEEVWKKTIKLLKSGLIIKEEKGLTKNNLPKKTENRVAHVRPHAQNKQDIDILPDGRKLTKQCFWLNAPYLKEQIEKTIH